MRWSTRLLNSLRTGWQCFSWSSAIGELNGSVHLRFSSRPMKDYYVWRGRIGRIYMAASTVMEPEFYAMAPEGISIHTDRIVLPAPTIPGLEKMMEGPEVRRC